MSGTAEPVNSTAGSTQDAKEVLMKSRIQQRQGQEIPLQTVWDPTTTPDIIRELALLTRDLKKKNKEIKRLTKLNKQENGIFRRIHKKYYYKNRDLEEERDMYFEICILLIVSTSLFCLIYFLRLP